MSATAATRRVSVLPASSPMSSPHPFWPIRPASRGPSLDDPHRFYARILDGLAASRIPFMVGGAYGFERYTSIKRASRDFDVFVQPDRVQRVLDYFSARGFRAEFTYPHWLGKIFDASAHVDVI